MFTEAASEAGGSSSSSSNSTSPDFDPKLVESDSWIRGSIPILPLPVAAACFLANLLLPGLGTVVSGFLCVCGCVGRPRFSATTLMEHRIGALLLNLLLGAVQLITVLLCLVGWCWSIGWGLSLIHIAKQNEEFLRGEIYDSEISSTPTSNNSSNMTVQIESSPSLSSCPSIDGEQRQKGRKKQKIIRFKYMSKSI